MTELKAQKLKAGLLGSPVFCTRTGNFLNKNNVLRAFQSAVKHANRLIGKNETPLETARLIPENIRFHDLRHSCASLLLSKGCSLRAVSARLEHANPALTLRVYAHCLPSDDAQLAGELDRMLS